MSQWKKDVVSTHEIGRLVWSCSELQSGAALLTIIAGHSLHECCRDSAGKDTCTNRYAADVFVAFSYLCNKTSQCERQMLISFVFLRSFSTVCFNTDADHHTDVIFSFLSLVFFSADADHHA